MADESERLPARPTPTAQMERLIEDQLRIMRKQLEVMRALQFADEAPSDDPISGTDGVRSAAIAAVAHDVQPTTVDVGSTSMTDVQRDVWVNCQLSREGSAAYDLTATLRLTGEVDEEALRESVRLLVQRHEALRTSFDADGARRSTHPSVDVELAVVDILDLPSAERTDRLDALVNAELSFPYDLVHGPLFRVTLVRQAATEHVVVLSGHHLVCDGWSLGVMMRDLGALYSAVVAGERPGLSNGTSFSEYVAWRSDQTAAAEPYWLGLYDEPPVELDLPTDRPRPPVRTYRYGTERAVIDGASIAALKDKAATHGVTLFVVLLGAWEILLHRLSGQGEFASGVFVSGQASMGARDLVGLCANLLPLRARISPDEAISDYLGRLKRSTFDALDNQCYSVGALASALSLPRDASRPTLVSTAITFETPTEGIEFTGLEAVPVNHGRRTFGTYDLEAYLSETAHDLTVDLQYSADLFEPATVQRWLGYYVRVLRQMATAANEPISGLRLLDRAERREILTRWNDTEAPVPDPSMSERFEQGAARHPDRVAIRTSTESVTYGELNSKANRLARHLRSLGVGPERVVGIHVERSPEMVVAMLAVHKAGGAFVPLDPLFPGERLAMIASDAGLHVLVTRAAWVGSVAAEGASIIALDRDRYQIDAHDGSDLGIRLAPDDLAYVIYTSGSTGRPKGVEIPQIALWNFLESMRLRPGLEADDVLLAVTTMSFDIAGLELFLPLIVGATVVLADAQEAVDAIWLRQRLDAGDITVMQATPATWQMLLDAGWTGTPGLKALCGGEALSRELAGALVTRAESLWNMYGPTETTIWSSVGEVSGSEGPISLGTPIHNTELHVLNPGLEVQPLGVPGELYIGGMGLARGYRNLDDLTSERFLTLQLDGELPRRLYRTGDVARRSADGRIAYLGRADFQVKIRGFRIELGEIETVLGRHPDVKECVVVARAGTDGSKRLVAYVVPAREQPIDVSTLRAYLRETLPDYMVPALFVTLDVFPLTANKKVDRARLPDPDGHRPDLSNELVMPRTETEAVLAGIWERLLDLEQVGIEDNFFDLGGDSLSALRAVMEANRSGLRLLPDSIFRYQTVAELAQTADAAAHANVDEQGVVTGPTPLTPAQLRFLDERRTPDPHHWNLSSLVYAERLSPNALRTALRALLSHHDALRLRLWQEDGRWRQEIAPPPEEFPLASYDLEVLPVGERTAAIERVCAELQDSFDFGEGLLIRAAYFDCGMNEPDRLFITIHHFAIDGLTWTVFWEDLEQAYLQAAEGSDVSLPPKTTSIKTWATQLERLVQTPRVVGTAEEWLRKPWHRVTSLPADFDASAEANTNASASTVEIDFSEHDTRTLLSGRERPEHVILTAVAGCLSRWTASPTVLIDVLSHGRDAAIEDTNLSRTVGFTLSYNPLVLEHATWDGTLQTVEAVSSQVDAGPDGYTFELLRFLASDPELRDRLTALPRADLLFNYAGVRNSESDDPLWREAQEPTGPDESPRGLRQYPIAVRAILAPNLRLIFIYSRALHRTETIEAKAIEVAGTIRELSRASVPSS